MTIATSPASLAVSVLAVLASGAFLRTMLASRDDPTTRPMVGIAAALLLGALVHLLFVDLAPVRAALRVPFSPTAVDGGYWVLLAFDLSAVVAGLWLLFALQYTGQSERTSRVAVVAVAVLLAVLVVPNLLLSAFGSILGVSTAYVNAQFGLTVTLANALGLTGVLLVLSTVGRHKAFPVAQTAGLTLAVGVVLSLPLVTVALPVPVVTPALVGAASVLFAATVRRYRVFESVPAATVVGRDRVLDEMAEGVVVLGDDGRVRDCNAEAERLLGVEHAGAVGEPLADGVPALADLDAVDAPATRTVRVDSRVLRVTVDPLTDARGRTLGRLFVCRDVTETRRRENRLAVLTQLVAGATSNQMASVAETADAIDAGDCDPTTGGARIRSTATDVATLVARVRDVERALAGERDAAEPTDLAALVAELDAAEATVAGEAELFVAADAPLLEAALETLVVGAGAAETRVDVRRTDDSALVEVSSFDAAGSASLASQALQIAELAADHAAWSVRAPVGEDAATVRVPLSESETGREPSDATVQTEDGTDETDDPTGGMA